jgi:competence protein ComEC
MFKWTPFVMVRICLFFIAGIVLGVYQPDFFSIAYLKVLILSLVVIYFLIYFFTKKPEYRKIIAGVAGLAGLFFTGNLLVLQKTESRKPHHLLHEIQLIRFYEGEVISSLDEKINSWKVLMEVDHIKTDSGWKKADGKVQVYISKKSAISVLDYGDTVIVKGSPEEVRPPANPGEFDFKRFLGFKNIYHQQFIKSENLRIINKTAKRSLLFYSYQLRSGATKIIKNFVKGERERAITLALVLGVTDGIDNDLLGAYSASGAMHVLSVSGLHVGVIYFILMLFLKPLSSFAWSRWLLALLTLLFLWSYAFVTGLSPSVLRAVMMFSFIAIAKPLGWKTNIYNTLAASAFILLIYNPYLVMSVGFQLSYIAVIGIVFLQRPLYNLWEPSSWLLDKVWQVTSVSIAAQLATFSLGLLYFHQFPVYFLFSNLIVIPLSTLVLLIGIFLLTVGSLPMIGAAVGLCLEWTIKLLNASVFWVESLPFSLIEDVYITTFQSCLLLAMITFLSFVFIYLKFKHLLLSAGCATLFAVLQWHHFYKDVKLNHFIVYQIPNHTAFEFISNGTAYFFADSALAKNSDKIHFHIQSNRTLAGVTNIHVNEAAGIAIYKRANFHYFVYQNRTILWIQNKSAKLPTNIKADYTVISNDGSFLLPSLKSKNLGQLILDGSCRLNKKQQEMSAIYSTKINNAFIVKL